MASARRSDYSFAQNKVSSAVAGVPLPALHQLDRGRSGVASVCAGGEKGIGIVALGAASAFPASVSRDGAAVANTAECRGRRTASHTAIASKTSASAIQAVRDFIAADDALRVARLPAREITVHFFFFADQ